MAYVCEICGKTNVYGTTQRHKRGVAGKRWKDRAQETKRLFKVNLQKAKFMIDGKEKQMRICTKCLKRVKKFGSIKNYKNIALA